MTNFSHVFIAPLRKVGKALWCNERTLDWKLSKLIKPRYVPQHAKWLSIRYQVERFYKIILNKKSNLSICATSLQKYQMTSPETLQRYIITVNSVPGLQPFEIQLKRNIWKREISSLTTRIFMPIIQDF